MAIIEQSPELLVPFPTVPVSPEVFESHPEAAFWIGKIATLAVKGIDPTGYQDALARFRGNVYVHERGFLQKDALDEFGREFDEYDTRSVHFAVIENETEINQTSRLVGSIRLVTKETTDDKLPIEKYFPELFEENPIDTNCVEVSRFISCYPEDKQFMQHVIALALIRAVTLYGVKEGIEDQYCVIEKPLYRSLHHIGIPLEVLGEPKDVPEQGGILYPIKISSQGCLDSVKYDKNKNIMLQDFFRQELGSGGEGYYPAGLVGGTYE